MSKQSKQTGINSIQLTHWPACRHYNPSPPLSSKHAHPTDIPSQLVTADVDNT